MLVVMTRLSVAGVEYVHEGDDHEKDADDDRVVVAVIITLRCGSRIRSSK